MVRRTKEEAEATRHLLLDAAEKVFNEKGVAQTSLADIATAAGLTRGAIYWHFESKADIFHAMLERVTLPIDNMVDQLGAEHMASPLTFLHNAAVTVLKRATTDEHTRRVFEIVSHQCELTGDMAIGRSRQLESRAECLGKVEQALKAAITQGDLPTGLDTRSAAFGLHSLIDGLISNWVLNPDAFDLEKNASQLIGIYINGLKIRLSNSSR